MSIRTGAVALAAGALVCLVGSEALAGISVLGIRPDNSWIATVSVDTTFNNGATVVSWDQMVLTEVDPSALPPLVLGAPFAPSPNVFEPPTVISNFDVAGWTQAGGATASTATANAATTAANINELQFDVHFTGNAVDGGAFRLDFYDNAQHVAFGWLYMRDVGAQAIQEAHYLAIAVVPLPPAAWAGLATLGAMGIFLVHRRRSRQLFV